LPYNKPSYHSLCIPTASQCFPLVGHKSPWRLHWGNCQHQETNRANSLLVFHPTQPPSRNVLAGFPIKIQQKSTKESKGVEGYSPYALWIPFHVNSTDENIKSESQLAATIYSMMLMLLLTVLRTKMLFHGMWVLQGLQRIIWWMMH
jgi:hypothetical protein